MLRLRNRDGIAIKSALVAVSGGPVDEFAVRYAAQMVESQRGSLYVVHVIEVDRGLPVDSELPFHTSRADDLLDKMERAADSFKCKVYPELLQARRAGHAIVNEAAERDVDVIVIGMPYKKKYSKFTLGDAVPYVLEHAPCRVLLWRGRSPKNRITNERHKTIETEPTFNRSMIDRPLLGPKHILIVGCGELGATVARELVEHGNTVHVLDRTPLAFKRLPETAVEERRILPVVGDGASHQDLIRAGIRDVDVFMSLMSSDTANILSAQAAKQIFSVEVVVCRVDDPDLQGMYEEMGLIAIGATSLLVDVAVHSATA